MRKVLFLFSFLIIFSSFRSVCQEIYDPSLSPWLGSNTGYNGVALTWPLNRTVFQRGTDGKAEVKFYAQLSISGSFPANSFRYLYQIFKLDKNGNRTGNPWTTYVTPIPSSSMPPDIYLSGGHGYGEVFPHFSDAGGNRTLELINIPVYNLCTGWYSITLHCVKGDLIQSSSRLKFGVGEVFTIYGQSNSSGLNQVQEAGLQPFSTSTTAYDMVNVIGKQALNSALSDQFKEMKSLPIVNYQPGYDARGNPIGVIDDLGFRKLERDNLSPTFRSNIYPRGNASWTWLPLGNKFADDGVPTLFFNAAFPGRNISELKDLSRDEYKTFRQTLQMYANITGVRSVLWHQGEYDAKKQLVEDASPTSNFSYYSGDRKDLIDQSRSHFNNNLTWVLSRGSFIAWKARRGSSLSIDWSETQTPNVAHNTVHNKTAPFDTGLYPIHLSETEYDNWYGNNPTKTKNFLTYNNSFNQSAMNYTSYSNYIGGFSTDEYGLNRRGPTFGIHLTGSALDEVATKWKSLPLTSGTPIKGKEVKKITVSRSGNSFILTAPEDYDKYFWVVNDNSIYNPLSNNRAIVVEDYSTTFKAITCYLGTKISEDSDQGNAESGWNLNFEVTNPFLIPGYVGQKTLNVPSNQNVNNSSGNFAIEVSALDISWSASSNVSWLQVPSASSTGGAGVKAVTINYSANSSGSSRVGVVTFAAQGSGGISRQLIVTQGIGNTPAVPLTTLTPTGTSGGYRMNKSIDNNTMQIAGVQYTQGIGVHASNTMTYNLGGQYSTFSGKIGQDDEANCGDGVAFSIKADGVTIYGPVTKTYGQPATNFSVSVSGKNTLELITDIKANNYCDHANWVDVYLQGGNGGCGTPPMAPSNVQASSYTINAGSSSTLSADCNIGTVTWNNGTTGNTNPVSPVVTTTYTVKCVSPGCPDSPVAGVTVNVTSSPCGPISDNLTMGTWTSGTGSPLVARRFHNQWWLTQRIGTNPEKFLVRGSGMLTRSDVNLSHGGYSSLVTCFAWQVTDFGSLETPNSTTFPTPNGFVLGYEPDGTPFYTATGGCPNPPSQPTGVSASPASINPGQPSTLSANCAIGTRLWSTGATTATITVNPTTTTTYSVKCVSSGCADSPSVSITVPVGPCSALSHNLVMGTWNNTGHPLVAKFYHNKWWLVQRISTSPEKFLVRGSQMLTRGDVSLNNSSYSNLVGCFGWTYSQHDGLATPNSTDFPTPSGWIYGTEPDGTPFYTSSGGARLGITEKLIPEEISSFLSVFPNPSQGIFTVKVNLLRASHLNIDLINSSGQIYQSTTAEGKIGENEILFTTSQNISAGNYLLRVKSSDKIESKSIVIIK